MKIHVVPASTKTATAAIRALLSQAELSETPIEITAVYRETKKAPAEFTSNSNFRAVQGDISDSSSLNFQGAEAVLTLTPPVFDGRNIVKNAETVSQNVKSAIESAGTVQRLVLLTSVYAHLSKGVGEIKTNNAAERIFSSAQVPRITFIRAAYFMENWMMAMDTLKAAPRPFFYSTITPLDYKVPMVAVRDIGQSMATQLVTEEQPRSPFIFELHGPRDYSPLDVQAAFIKVMGKVVEIKPIEQDQLQGFYEKILHPAIVGEWVEMAKSFLPGSLILTKDYLPMEEEQGIVRGSTGLEEAIGDGIYQERLAK